MQFLLVYFIAVSAASIFFTVYDKRAAVCGKWRISEKMLFFIAMLGGSVSMYLTMKAVRHKTRHKKFMIGLPIVIILQIAAVSAICYIKYGRC